MQTGASYINFKNITDMKDLVKTITHKNQRSMDIQDHRDINKNRDEIPNTHQISQILREVKHLIEAISKQWRDFLNTKSINREDKLLNNMIENGGNIFRHTIFQGANYELRNTIKDNTIGGSGNE